MKIISIILAFFIGFSALAQKPNYVPFIYRGQTGIIDMKGKEFLSPGVFGDYYMVVGDFKSYLVKDDLLTGQDFFFNASSGKGEDSISGRFDRNAGKLAVGNDTYYHFWVDGTSVMYSPEQGSVHLQQFYINIEPNQQAWSNEGLQDKPVVWALKEDGTYDALVSGNQFTPVEDLPPFESYDLIFYASGTEPMKPAGFVLGSSETIARDFGQMYGIPPSDQKIEVYDLDFKKLGTSAYRTKAISVLFKKNILLRGRMIPPPEIRNRIIRFEGETVVLNEEYSLIPESANEQRLVLVSTKKNNEPVLGKGNFAYRYFSTADNPEALLQIRHAESGSIFYFDFEGTFFPRGMPMIPKDKMKWKDDFSLD